MKQSLQEFNFNFLNDLRNLHWRQWAALGVAAHIEPENEAVIDIEALIVSTFVILKLDIRLFESMLEWVNRYKDFVMVARINRIAGEFSKRTIGKNLRLIDEDKADLLKQIKKYREFYKGLREDYPKDLETVDIDYVKDNLFRGKKIISQPDFSNSSALHLKLRSFTGTDTRADVLFYLLLSDEGNSYSIAKEIFHDQKNVYRILEQWSDAGMVTKIEEARKNRYLLNNKNEWLKLFGYTSFPKYVNWTRVFLLYNTIAKALVTEPWRNDEYLMTSLLNDLENEIKAVEVMGGEVRKIRNMQHCMYSFWGKEVV